MKRREKWTNFIFYTAEIFAIIGVVAFFWQKAVLYDKYSLLIESLEKSSQRHYTEQYQCLDYSRDLSSDLQRIGVPNKIEIVRKKESGENEYHSVISIQLEPQNGKIVDYQKVDSCFMDKGLLKCQNGLLMDKNMYVAGKEL